MNTTISIARAKNGWLVEIVTAHAEGAENMVFIFETKERLMAFLNERVL